MLSNFNLSLFKALGMSPAPTAARPADILPGTDLLGGAPDDRLEDRLDAAWDEAMQDETFADARRDGAAAIAAPDPAAGTGPAAEAAAALPEAPAPEVLAVTVDPPGASRPAAPEAGFRTALGPEDELTLNIAPDLPGRILAVHAVYDLLPGDEAALLTSTVNFYLAPEEQALPADRITGSETDFIAAHGLQKLGQVDMGRVQAHVDPDTGEVVVTEDSRQPGPPRVVANRSVTELSALFH